MLQWNQRASLGSPESIRAKLPACYSQEFDKCLSEYRTAKRQNREPAPSAFCSPFYKIIDEESATDWDAALTLMPYCPGVTQAKQKRGGFWPALAVIGIAGGVLAVVVNATGSRF